MPPALTPALAADYVRELSADVRAVVVLDAAGTAVAGPPELGPPARALLDADPAAAELEAVRPEGVVCTARTASAAIVAVCGPYALPAVTRADLRTALAALEDAPPPSPPRPSPEPPPAAVADAADALISAAQRHSRP